MTTFEFFYLCAEPFCPPLQREIRTKLKRIVAAGPKAMKILDSGGRFSNYTIGLPASITVTDIPRNTAVQQALHLGTTDIRMNRLLRRRSNVTEALYDDMTHSNLPSNSFDCVVAVEVLEHVERDDLFVAEVKRVLKPGMTFLMSTPNGEFVVNRNPDHKRHYTRQQLTDLLKQHFTNVEVDYAVRTGYFYGLSLRSWSLRHPLRTLMTMFGAWIAAFQSADKSVPTDHHGTHQLIARMVKDEAAVEDPNRTMNAAVGKA